MKTIKTKVKGMTCASCEVILERKLKKSNLVSKARVNRAKETLEVYCKDSTELEDLQALLSGTEYFLIAEDTIDNPVRPAFIVKNKKKYAEIAAVLLFMAAAYFILTQFDLLPKGIGVTENMSYGFVFLIGLVAATSTCLAVAGGLLLAVANKYNEANPHLTAQQRFRPHISFNIGRLVSYAILGAAIGALGSVLTLSSTASGIITLAASALMIIMGLQLLQISPWLSKIQLKMPKSVAHKLFDSSQGENSGMVGAFLFGASTFFLPCGFTQALQLYVLGRGDPFTGMMVMFIFALGTLPSLIGVGALSSFSKGKTKQYFTTFSAVLVIVLGIFNISPGLVLVGASGDFSLPFVQGQSLELGSEEIFAGNGELPEKQIVELEVRGLDYFPAEFTIQKGVPVEWQIDGSAAVGCAQIISIPALGITEQLPQDESLTITFTPEESGRLIFSCGMGMAGPGVFNVV